MKVIKDKKIQAYKGFIVCLVVALVALGASQVHAGPTQLEEVEVWLEDWQLGDAAIRAEEMYAADSNDSFARYALGKVRFYQGRYPEALDLIDRAIAAQKMLPVDWKYFRELVASTKEATSKHLTWKTPDGHFVIRYLPRDEVLLPYAQEVLEKAWKELGKAFDFYPEHPIPVEFYPSAAELAKVSSLSEENIKTSGTIALCKYNRLMVTSPRALLQGYGWADTIAHEYIHYLVSVKSKNTVPIWLQEGLAKFYEQRWRGKKKGELPPSQERLLTEALSRGHLITFAQMHPSMAKLPSQNDTALAFAEVFTAVEYLYGKIGDTGIQGLLVTMSAGVDVEEALSKKLGVSFAAFQKDWELYLKARPREDRKGLLPRELVFRTEKGSPKEVDPEAGHDELSPETKKYFRLGELLLAQGKSRAAVVELEKAKKSDKSYGLALPVKLAKAYLAAGANKSAALTAKEVTALYPDYVSGWLIGGRALLAQSLFKEAAMYLREAVLLNPFDPQAHRDYGKALEGMGDTEGAAREKKATEQVEKL